MADRLPLRIVYVNGVPTIGEFQRGDTVGVNSGGTGVSSLNELADLLDAIPGGALSSLTDDVGIGFPFSDPAYGDVLTWTGSRWEAEHVPHMAFADYSGAPYDISSVSFLTNLGSITLQEGEIAWDGTASTIQVQTDASTTQLAVLQVSSASNDGDILLWDGTNGYYYPTSAFVDVSSQVDVNTSALENTLDASDLSVELSAISTELSAIAVDISAVGIEVSSVSVQLSSLVSSIHLSGLGDTTFTDLSTHQHIVYDGASWVNAYNDTTEMTVRNGTASAMSKGDVIAIQNAHNQNLVNVILADASQTSAMPALGILEQDLAVGAEGIAITFGKAQGLNTSGLTEGATAYVSPTTPGTITETKPTDADHLIQNIGIIMRAHPSNGAIKVTGIGRANDIDNQTRVDLRFLNGTTLMPASNSNFSAMPAWTEGTHNQGSYWLNVSYNDPDESVREYRPDPFNGSSIIWVAKDLDLSAQVYDGGFDTSNVPIDAAYTYRISGFVKQHTPTSGTNYFSYGPMHNFTSDPTKTVVLTTNGAKETNPRFRTFHDLPTYDEWYLLVGHVQASSTTFPATKHENTGVWDLDGNLTQTSYNDFAFSSTATQMGCRFHHYNNPNGTGDEMEFFGPRIDKLDGNEPSIDDLLKRFTTQHGQLDGLDQNDHPQYVLSSTNSALSSQVDTNTSAIDNALDLSDIVTYIEHGDLNGLGDNDHPQYVLSAVPTMTEGGSSVTGVGACPHPQPFWYGETVTSATAARSYLWGDSTTSTIETVCDDHFQWDSAGKLYVSSTGVYEVDCMFVVYAASDHEMETSIEVDGVTQNATQKNHFHNYKNEYHIRWVGKISAGSYISARNKDVAVVISSRNLPGSTMIVKRLA